eukprot:5956511-Prymnesium_polylepis.1
MRRTAVKAASAPPLRPPDEESTDLVFAAQDGFESTAAARDSPDVVAHFKISSSQRIAQLNERTLSMTTTAPRGLRAEERERGSRRARERG